MKLVKKINKLFLALTVFETLRSSLDRGCFSIIPCEVHCDFFIESLLAEKLRVETSMLIDDITR